jgi:hypothetical protein
LNERFVDDAVARRCIIGSGLLCAAIFAATIPFPRVDGHLLGSDGLSYYAILRSVILDGDLDLANDYVLVDASLRGVTVAGLRENPFAIGASILWFPFFLIAHALSHLLVALGVNVATNGVTYIYETAISAGTISYATLAFLLVYRIARRLSDAASALFAVLAMWWATQAIYYVVAEPSMSHGLTIFSGAVFLTVWYPPPLDRSSADWVKIGLATALNALVRWQQGIIVLIPIAELFWRRKQRRLSLSAATWRLALLIAAVLLGFTPQFWMWLTLYARPITIPQGSHFMDWFGPNPLLTLFSTRHGLITWHPIFLLALLGLPRLWKRDRALALAIAFVALGQLYINSAVRDWWGNDGFGGRRFTTLVPYLTLSLAALLHGIRSTKAQRWMIGCLIALVLWNGLSFAQYRLGFVSKSEALTAREMTIDRLLVPWSIYRRLIEAPPSSLPR